MAHMTEVHFSYFLTSLELHLYEGLSFVLSVLFAAGQTLELKVTLLKRLLSLCH